MTAIEHLQAMSDTEFQSYVNWFTPDPPEWECWGFCRTDHGFVTKYMVDQEIRRRDRAGLAALGL